jgi:hypothetical protein
MLGIAGDNVSPADVGKLEAILIINVLFQPNREICEFYEISGAEWCK